MKVLLSTAAAIALLALASPVSAQQMYGSTEPGDYPGNSSVGGPQWQWMAEHGSTTNDALPYGGNDVFSDQLNEQGLARDRGRVYAAPPVPQWEAH